MSLAARLGSFAAEMRPGDLSPDVIEQLKLRLLDLFGAAVSGIEAGGWRAFANEPAAGSACIWPSGRQGAAREAAFLNSFVSHATYMEDGSRFTGGHPSSVVVPAALAAFEDAGRGSGTDFLVAMATGYEVFLRLGRTVYPEIVQRGFQSTAALGAVASAAAVASAHKLSRAEAGNAIAIAATMGFGLKHALKAPASQPVQVARACQGGVIACEAAARGATGSADILEASLLPMYGATGAPQGITEGLGRTFSVSETYIKLHGGCRGNHAPIDIVQDLLLRSGRAVEEIATIRIAVDSVTHAADIEDPQTPGQAQFSARFAVAAHLLTGDALPRRYSAIRLADPDQQALMAKIALMVSPELDSSYPEQRGAWAQIDFTDGRSISDTVALACGEPETPVSLAAVETKFQRLAGASLGDDAARLRDLVADLERLSDVKQLTVLLGRATHHPQATGKENALEIQQ
ncbi:MAG: putative protein involved in propionate catabolism [Rhodobacteraceae bacterium HLUCCA12]|nr:MAG: putative protein involved in propionate catabolism [Rhodobacteraceae bacterium HLUCCA12]